MRIICNNDTFCDSTNVLVKIGFFVCVSVKKRTPIKPTPCESPTPYKTEPSRVSLSHILASLRLNRNFQHRWREARHHVLVD